MNASRERVIIRTLHLVLSVPILGFLYGPLSHIPPAAFFARAIAFPLVVASGIWIWLKPRFMRWRGNGGIPSYKRQLKILR